MKPYRCLDKKSWYHWVFKNYPVLPAETFNELYTRKEELPIREKLVLSNARLVYSIAKMYAKPHATHTIDDLMDIGMIGLQKALENYDPAKGAISTHAKGWIKQEIQLATRQERGTIVVAQNTNVLIGRLLSAQKTLRQTLNMPIPLEEMWPYLELAELMTEAEYKRAMQGLQTFAVSSLGDIRDPEPIHRPDYRLSCAEETRTIREKKTKLEQELTPFELAILEAHEVHGEHYSSIAKRLRSPKSKVNVTDKRIQQIATAAKARLLQRYAG